MRIFDISQEVFSCAVFPGDPSPERTVMMKISDGGVCNLTALKMCAHNGTHIDAPFHFIDQGKTIDQVSLDRFIGYAYVASHEGDLSSEDAEEIIRKAKAAAADSGITGCDCFSRILVKGKAVVTEQAAKVFADRRILLFGNESQLGSEIVLLEGRRRAEVEDGVYFLNAAPINLGGSDGAPCRAWLADQA